MAGRGLNRVMLIGNLGSDPELRHTPGGQPVATFSLATNESWGGRDGAPPQERTEWHRIVVWGRTAEVCNEYLRKGRQIFVEGRIQTRQWQDQQGNKRSTTEIVANQVMMLGGRPGDASPMGEGSGRSMREPAGVSEPVEGSEAAAGPEFIEDDNDLPF
jgi:single-strand DNA-binding protein